MRSLNSAASAPLTPSFLYTGSEGSGLGVGGGKQKSDDAQEVTFADEVIVGEDYDRPQQTLSTPQLPPRAVIEYHGVGNCTYRSWCDGRVEGFCHSLAHGHVDDADRIVMISMDYAFLIRQGAIVSAGYEGWDEQLWSDPTALKLLVVKDTESRSVFAHAVVWKRHR